MGKNLVKTTHTFLFCDGSSCQKAGGENVARAARSYLRNHNLWDTTHTIKTRCNGRCEDAPTCIVQTGDFWYKELTPAKIKEVVAAHTQNAAPIEDYLLYKKGDDKMDSSNERAVIKPKDFIEKQDDELGNVYITKGFNSDQYLFPFFEYILEQNITGKITFADGKLYQFSDLRTVTYTSTYIMYLGFNNGDKQSITLGSVPKQESRELFESKISSSEYFINKDNFKKGVRFKNKIGKFVALIKMEAKDDAFWNYCLKTQLLGLSNPLQTKAIV